jgi:hypothetical protein
MSLPKASQFLEQLVCLSSRRVLANGNLTHRILSMAAIVLLCAASLWWVKTPIQAAGNTNLSLNALVDDQQVSTVVAVSAASFDLGPVAPDSIVACFGANLATRVEIGATSPLPISLAGASVRVRDSQGVERQAGLFFVSPFQINLAIPANTAAGEAELIVTNGESIVSARSCANQPHRAGAFHRQLKRARSTGRLGFARCRRHRSANDDASCAFRHTIQPLYHRAGGREFRSG